MDFYTVIKTRRTVRNFSDREVGDEIIKIIITAAICAPSGYHAEPWRFVVVRDQARKEKLASAHQYAGMLAQASVVIVALYDKKKASPNSISDFLSVALAVENLLLAARAEGLGACWVYADEKKDPTIGQHFREVVDADENFECVAVVPLGYPANGEKAFTEKKPDVSKCLDYEKVR